MARGIFITATGTDVGKTYVTALIVKKLRDLGLNAGYYKAALSGAENIENSDAGYVNKIAGINQREESMVSYLYKNPLSPHLSAKIEGNPVDLEVVKRDFSGVCKDYDYVTVEGSGGIVCPIRHDEKAVIFLEDIIKALKLPTLIVADAGLGTINAVVTTVEYMRAREIPIKGIIFNNCGLNPVMEDDNGKMIEEITDLPILAKVRQYDSKIDIDKEVLMNLYGEVR
jgi:dethiobiotin synthetase